LRIPTPKPATARQIGIRRISFPLAVIAPAKEPTHDTASVTTDVTVVRIADISFSPFFIFLSNELFT
jgi:hypothetical protein